MSLFPKIDHKQFMARTRNRYKTMALRIKRKKLGPMPFSSDEYRKWIMKCTGGSADGVIRCRYCGCYIHIWEVEADHAIPLSRGGSTGLDNLDLICETDNSQKGSMTPDEYIRLLQFLDLILPLARTDILRRLRTANKLAAGTAYRNKKAREKNGTDNEIGRVPTT